MANSPDLSRNTALAGQTVSKDSYNITYDSNEYGTSVTNYGHEHFAGTDRSLAAGSFPNKSVTLTRAFPLIA